MNNSTQVSAMCAPGAPISVRTYSSVMNFPGRYIDGLIALQGAEWVPHGHDRTSLVSPDKDSIAWYTGDAWHMARRHCTACFDPTEDRALAHGVLGEPHVSFVLPTTIVVPLKGGSSPTGHGCHCLRIYPAEQEPPHEILILGERVEFRVCVSQHDSQVQTFVEANLGGARFTGDRPRRAVYLPDHKLLPSVPVNDLIAKVLLYLPKFTHQAGFLFDPLGQRSDIPRVGSYGVLPRHGSFYGELRLPAPSRTALIAFDASGRHRIARAPVIPATIVAEEDDLTCPTSVVLEKGRWPKPLPLIASFADALRAMTTAKTWQITMGYPRA